VEGPVVIFANEWLDALPFHRLLFSNGEWREKGVFSPQKGQLKEVLLDTLSPAVSAVAERLPKTAPEGYQLDWPLAAENALTELMACEWSGLFLCFDYGKSWHTLLHDCPEGTARTYQNHVQGNDLLAAPGAQDITCDIIWDPLKSLLHSVCASEPVLESQEAFLVQRAQRAAARIVEASAGTFSEAKQSLMQLMHPAHMGQRFQVLWGLRD
jgi:SAM-dependent MidA family methyltransferase